MGAAGRSRTAAVPTLGRSITGNREPGTPAQEVAVPRVLIVEDEPEIQELIGDLLILEGYEVHGLGRIPHGLDAIRDLDPDVIVLDLRLPGVGGVEFLRLLRADRQLAPTPVLIVSGARDLRKAHADEFAELGCEFLQKPFELDSILDVIRDELARTCSPRIAEGRQN